MKESWISVRKMPYRYFTETIQWKLKLEEEKKKQMEEHSKKSGNYRKKK